MIEGIRLAIMAQPCENKFFAKTPEQHNQELNNLMILLPINIKIAIDSESERNAVILLLKNQNKVLTFYYMLILKLCYERKNPDFALSLLCEFIEKNLKAPAQIDASSYPNKDIVDSLLCLLFCYPEIFVSTLENQEIMEKTSMFNQFSLQTCHNNFSRIAVLLSLENLLSGNNDQHCNIFKKLKEGVILPEGIDSVNAHIKYCLNICTTSKQELDTIKLENTEKVWDISTAICMTFLIMVHFFINII